MGAVLVAVTLMLSGCSSSDELSAGDAATVADGSRGEYAVDGGDWTAVSEAARIPDGAQVRPAGGELQLVFRDGTARLAPDSSAVVTAQRITVERGEALVSSEGDLSGAVGETVVEGASQYRLAGGLSSRVGVYDGAVTVRRPAQEQAVGALRELDLAGFRLGAEEPLHYNETDAWDQELLRRAIAFDGEAARLRRGMDVDLGRRPLRERFYRQFTSPSVVDVLAAQAPVSRRGAFGPPSDVLLAVFLAEAAGGDDVRAAREVASLRGAGARWGLIALDLGVPSQEVVAAIDGLDGARIAAADRPRPRPRRGGAAASETGGDDGGQVAVAEGPGDTTTTITGDDGTSGSDDRDSPRDGGSQTPPPDEGGKDPGGKDPGGKDPGGKNPDDGPGEEEPTPVEAVTRVVKDVVGQVPGVPDPDSVPALP